MSLLAAACAVLVIIAGVYVFSPLFRASGNGPAAGLAGETEADRLAGRKTAVYKSLRDLKFEYKMGRLSDSDFRRLEEDYRNEAVTILRKLDQMGALQNVDEAIEKEVAQRRAKLASSAPAHARCSSCGAEIIPGKKFCADCGHKYE
jgi:ribosomal protein L32